MKHVRTKLVFGEDAFEKLQNAKILLLGPSGPHFADLVTEARSLNLEHVSPALLVQQEISRRTSIGQQADQALTRGSAVPDRLHFALLRKYSRK